MNKREFIGAMFDLFGKENKEALFKQYEIGLETSKPVDWSKLYKRVITTMQDKFLPKPAYFRGLFDYCLIDTCNNNEGAKYLIEWKDGKRSVYESASNCGKIQSLKDIEESGKAKRIIKYPSEASIRICYGGESVKVSFDINPRTVKGYYRMTESEQASALDKREAELKKLAKIVYQSN